MFKFLNKIIFNDGYQAGKMVIDSSLNRQISDLKTEVTNQKTAGSFLLKEYNDLIRISAKEKIQITKDAEKELAEIKAEYKNGIQRSKEITKIYEEKINQLRASELYIKNHIESQAQINLTASARFSDDINQIEIQKNKDLKKI